MQVFWIYEGCDKHDQEHIEQYWRQAQDKLESKTTQKVDAGTDLRVAVDHQDASPAWVMEAALHTVAHTLTARSEAQTAEEVIDRLLSSLALELDRVEEQPTTVAKRRSGLEGIVPLLANWRTNQRSAAFMSFLAPVVASLRPYVRRELQIRKNDQTLAGHQVVTTDVLDDVLVQAWEQFMRRDNKLALDLWLVQLADQIIERLSASAAQESLDAPAPRPSRDPQESHRDEWIEQPSYPETLELSELLPGDDGAAAWDSLDMETKQAHLDHILSGVDRQKRQAFVLNVADGFSTAEIADFQDRPVEQVENDVNEVMWSLERQLTRDESPDLQEPFEREALRERRRKRS